MGRAMLLIVSGMLVVYGIIFQSVINRQESTGLVTRSTDFIEDQQGKNVTASLMDMAIREISRNQENNQDWSYNWGGSFSFTDFLGAETASLDGFDQDMQSTSEYPSDDNVSRAGGWNKYRVLLYAEAKYHEKTTKTEVLLQQDSFAKYSYFTHFEPSYIWFMDKDTLTGPVHTNGEFHIAGSPVFNGYVTSPNDWVGHTSYTNDPQFNGGSNFNAPQKDLPDANGEQTENLVNVAQVNNTHYENPIYVQMQGDNSPPRVRILENKYNDWNTATETFIDKTTYDQSVISSNEKVYIDGKLDGKLTVHSKNEIEIMGDIEYMRDPRVDSTSTDLLGLVSEGHVKVDDNAHTANGSQDINIHASVMALNGSFYVEDYWDGSPRGEIDLLGGLIQYERGPVGTFSNGSINSGFSKNYQYDSRLQTAIPPHFPRESPFSIVYWRDRTSFE